MKMRTGARIKRSITGNAARSYQLPRQDFLIFSHIYLIQVPVTQVIFLPVQYCRYINRITGIKSLFRMPSSAIMISTKTFKTARNIVTDILYCPTESSIYRCPYRTGKVNATMIVSSGITAIPLFFVPNISISNNGSALSFAAS